jgi:hypothetical protein
VSDIDTAAADSLKALDPKWPIREADIGLAKKTNGNKERHPARGAVSVTPQADLCT